MIIDSRILINSAIVCIMPLKNCTHCLKRNPPLVTFFVCLVIITAVTVFFTFYVKNNDNIINSDAKQNWVSLTRHLNRLDLCISNSTDNLTNSNYDYDTSFVTLVNLNLSQFTNVTQIHAYYNLEGWHSLCVGSPDFLTLDLFLAPNSNESEKICAIIKGPSEFLPEISTNSCGFYDDVDDNVTLTLHSHARFCDSSSNLTKINILFDEKEEFVTYLKQGDRNVIYLHLLWTSSILLFFILIMLIYAMFYQSEYVAKTYRLG